MLKVRVTLNSNISRVEMDRNVLQMSVRVG